MSGAPFVVSIIPARGGSQRVPDKNLRLLGGKPLLSYTVEASLNARWVDRTYVSTDSARIAACAQLHGAQVVKRPTALAGPTASSELALLHGLTAIETREMRRVDVLVMLQATSPLRPSERIDQAVKLLLTEGCDSVVSVVADVEYYFLGEVDYRGRLKVGYDPKNRLRTQDIPARYRENGAVYVMKRDLLVTEQCRMGGDMRALIMTAQESVDIDTMVDFARCEALLHDQRSAQAAEPPPDNVAWH